AYTAAHFLDRGADILQRYGTHADEPVGMLRHGRRHAVVDRARSLAGDIRIGVIEVLTRARANRLNVDTEPVHIGDALVDRVERAADGCELGAVDFARLRAGEIVDPGRGPRMASLHDRVGGGNAEVAMNVHHQ